MSENDFEGFDEHRSEHARDNASELAWSRTERFQLSIQRISEAGRSPSR